MGTTATSSIGVMHAALCQPRRHSVIPCGFIANRTHQMAFQLASASLRVRPAVAFQSKLVSQRIPSFYSARHQQRAYRSIVMAADAGSQQLDKNTPEETWKKLLNPQEYHVLRQKGTEPAGTGEYNKMPAGAEGDFTCRGCGAVLYNTEQKFNSGCGWPAFYDNAKDAVDRHEDISMGMKRVEITCKNCGGHLGHVFSGEGFQTPTDERHCVNSLSIKFVPRLK